MKSNVLITSAGNRVELVQAFQRDLKIFFSSARVFATDMQPLLLQRVRLRIDIGKYRELPINSIWMCYWILSEEYIGMLVPTIDTELTVLAVNRKNLRMKVSMSLSRQKS